MAYLKTLKKPWILAAAIWLCSIPFGANATWEPTVLNQHPFNVDAAWDMALGEHTFWFAYYGSDGRLYVRRPDGSELGFGATDRQTALSGLAMAVADDQLSVLWRDKLPEKTLYFLPELTKAGDVPSPIVVGGPESEALTRLKIARQGNITDFLWLGEKGREEPKAFKNEQKTSAKPDYNLYFRTAADNGKLLSPIEKVVTGFYPAWIIGTEIIPIFSWTAIDGQLAMAMRGFDRIKKTFGPLVKITDAPEIGPIFEAFESKGRWFLVWVGIYNGTQNDFLLEGVYSDDKGQTWTRFGFEPLRGVDIGGNLSVAVDGKGHILLAVAGSRRHQDAKSKQDVYLLRSDDNGSSWAAPYQPRAIDTRYTQARFPAVVMGPKEGMALLVWEDWRDIRPSVYVSASTDYGVSWSDAVPVNHPGSERIGLDFRTQTIGVIGDRYQLLAKRYEDDDLKVVKQALLYTFTWDELQQRVKSWRAEAASPNASETHLREQIAHYWQAMIDDQYETTYASQDPFFRTDVSYKSYRERMGIIKYHSYKVAEVNLLRPNLAKVTVEVEASVPGFKSSTTGQVYTQPKKARIFTETWLFLDGDWYHEYYDEYNDYRHSQY